MKQITLQFKRALRSVLFILLLGAVGMTKGYAYFWFSARCSTGQTLYYNFNGTGSVELTYPGHLHSVIMGSFYGYDGWDGFDKPMGNIVLPDSVQYEGVFYSVTSIGEWAFSRCSSVTSIEIPNSVSHIGKSALYCCSSLTSIVIPSSVTYIDDYAFNFTGLTSIVIPNSVDYIGINPFCCSGLEQITVQEGNNAFYDSRNNCNAIINSSTSELISGCKNTVIPNSVTSIKMEAFNSCTGLTSIEIPNSVTYIGDAAFYCCTGLNSIEIPNSVTSIRGETFYNCSSLSSIEIPKSVTYIGDAAFYGCTGLTSMTVWANNPPALGNYVFDQVNKSIPVYIPVGSLQDYRNANSWNEFTNFVELIIFADADVKALCVSHWDTDGDGELSSAEAAAVTSLENVFNGKSSITSFNELQYFIGLTSIGSHEFYNCHRLTSIKIPNSVTSIGSYAFYDCTRLTSIEIPNSVTSIGSYAFYDCTGLTTIAIPNFVTSIGEAAFYGCTGLTTIEIPNFVTSIGEAAFYGCTGLTTIEIPNSVISIGEAAFYGCSGLTSMTVLANIPPELGSDAFHGVDISIPVYVPCGFLEDYQNTDGWNGFIDIKALCPGVVSVIINPSEGGTVTGTGYYDGGELCVLKAIPNPYYSFGYWTENGNVVSTNAQYTFTVTGNRTLEANFYVGSINGGDLIIGNGYTYPCDYLPSHSYNKYALSQQIYTTDELGTAGYIYVIGFYNAGAENTRTYDIYLKPTLKDSFSYADWEIVSDSNLVFSGDVTMQANDWTYITLDTPFAYDGNRNVVLVMDDNTGSYTTSEPLFMRCHIFSTSGAQAIYSYNDYTNYDPSSPPYTCTTQSVKNQLFVTKGPAPTFNVSVSANPTEGGTVTGAGTYIQGRNCTVTATANPGYVFVNWRENGEVVSSNASYSFAVNDYRSLVAQFVLSTPVDNIFFADTIVKALCVAPATNWDTNGDGELSYAEAAAVTSLGNVFYRKSSITSFDELQYFLGLTSIGNNAFEQCTNLTSIELPNSLTYIGEEAFRYCTSLTSIEIPNSVNSIYYDAFSHCDSFTSMTVWAEDPPTVVGNYNFYNINQSIPVYVPCGSLEAYQSAAGWNQFTNIQEVCTQTQTIELVVGWNWFSTNLEITLDELKEALIEVAPGTNILIKSKTQNTVYNPVTNQWRGTLNTLDLTQMYLISVCTNCEIILTGTPINPTEHPITIQNGFNWIEFPLSENMSISNAFEGIVVNGDVIQSKTNNASYINGQWRGNFNTLEPGKGYIYKSNSSEPKTLVY